MCRIIIVRPGSTDYDEQGRITGSLSVPLSQNGTSQAEEIAVQLTDQPIQQIYTAPCESAQQTAGELGKSCKVKVKVIDKLHNLDLGLWNGKLVEELRHRQPKIYRRWQDHPETVCPPGGETLEDAKERVRKLISKIIRKNKGDVVAIVLPEPMASIVVSMLGPKAVGDLWKTESSSIRWESVDVLPESLVLN